MTNTKTIAIASDHAGFDLKTILVNRLRGQGYVVNDLGPDNTASVDYPDYGARLGQAVSDDPSLTGIAICGSGLGISMAVNRFPKARAAVVSDPLSSELARRHNDANVMALGARLIGIDMAWRCVEVFLSTDFEGGRHARRVEKLSQAVQTGALVEE